MKINLGAKPSHVDLLGEEVFRLCLMAHEYGLNPNVRAGDLTGWGWKLNDLGNQVKIQCPYYLPFPWQDNSWGSLLNELDLAEAVAVTQLFVFTRAQFLETKPSSPCSEVEEATQLFLLHLGYMALPTFCTPLKQKIEAQLFEYFDSVPQPSTMTELDIIKFHKWRGSKLVTTSI